MIIRKVSLCLVRFYLFHQVLVACNCWFAVWSFEGAFKLNGRCFLFKIILKVLIYLNNASQIVFTIVVNFIQLKLSLFDLFLQIFFNRFTFIRPEEIFKFRLHVSVLLFFLNVSYDFLQHHDYRLLDVKLKAKRFGRR